MLSTPSSVPHARVWRLSKEPWKGPKFERTVKIPPSRRREIKLLILHEPTLKGPASLICEQLPRSSHAQPFHGEKGCFRRRTTRTRLFLVYAVGNHRIRIGLP